jgi:hypothetical protein
VVKTPKADLPNFLGIFGTAAAFIALCAQTWGEWMNWWTLGILYFASVAAVAISICVHLLPHWHWGLRTLVSLVWVGALGALGVHGTRIQYQKEHAIPPDAVLHFVFPTQPSLLIENLSDQVVRDVKYSVELWNRDLPDRDDPIPIPVSTFDFINGRQTAGPMSLFHNIQTFVKPGDSLYGTASVVLPGGKAHTYLMHIIFGSGGWYAEVKSFTNGDLVIPHIPISRENREAYCVMIESTPPGSRMPIANWTPPSAPQKLFNP